MVVFFYAMSEWIWSNGELIAADELRVSPFDRGLTVGLGLFETILAHEGCPVFLDRHLARHFLGCERFGWQQGDPLALERGIHEVLKANELTTGKARVRLFRTAGPGPLAELSAGPDARTLITATPLEPGREMVSITLSSWTRNERSPLAGLKCASYAENLLALAAAAADGFDETVFLNTRQEVCEAGTANLFLVRNGTLLTPALDSGCLPGIMRAHVLELARNLGLPAVEQSIHPDDLHQADELFLTSALRGIVPVVRFQSRELPQGPLTLRLRHADHRLRLSRSTDGR